MIGTVTTNRRAGFATLTSATGQKRMDTATCRHCNRVWCVRSDDKAQPTSLGGFCRCCMAMICDACCGKPCVTIEQRLEEIESRARVGRALGA